MDLWLVAAAAGAGYLVKYWQHLTVERDGLSKSSSGDSNVEKTEPLDCPFRRLKQRKKDCNYASTSKGTASDVTFSDISPPDGTLGLDEASRDVFSGEKLESSRNYQDLNVLSISNIQMGPLGDENLKEDVKGNELTGNDIESGDAIPDPCNGEMGCFSSSMKKRRSFRTKWLSTCSITPVSSLDSCLMAQLYKEHAEMDEYVVTPLPSPSSPTMRKLFVTDGNRMIIKTHDGRFIAQNGNKEIKFGNNSLLQEFENVYGLPPLPKLGSLNLAKKIELTTGKGQNGKLSSPSKISNRKPLKSKGLPDGTSLFCLGISIGIMSSIMANKREFDELKELLKQTENLIQDLQEELEMKDSMTVKELTNENYESHDTCGSFIYERVANLFPHVQKTSNDITKYDGRDAYFQKAEESSEESMSKIEAELEVELERLGLNMNASTLDKKLYDFVELDPDFEADFAQGELRADKVSEQVTGPPKSKQDESSTSPTHHSGNYAVSPRELSLRLHEVIQSRLEDRIYELEEALQNSQRKLQIMESESKKSTESSNNEIQVARNRNVVTEPLVLNLIGEAFDAYNEAHEELMRTSNSDEEDLPHSVYESVQCSPFVGQSQNEAQFAISKEKSSLDEFFWKKFENLEEHWSWVKESNDGSDSRDEISDCDDEMENQLIKQIVERTKKGSPVVLNAQRLLFSMDEKEPQVDRNMF